MSRIALIDNFDSFTYNLQHYILSLGVDCKVIRVDNVSLGSLKEMEISGIIISPGPGRSTERPVLTSIIKSFGDSLPILGICLGHQAIGEAFGLMLEKAEKPMHGKQDYIIHKEHPMFLGISSPMAIMRYHSLILKGNPDELEITAVTKNKEIMALAHRIKPIWSFQFHPESILTPQGLELLNNWLMFFGIKEETLVLKEYR